MRTRQLQLTPPTVNREKLYQFLQTNRRLMATRANDNQKSQKKPILIVRTSEAHSSKTTSRNVHFSPEIILDDEQVIPGRIASELIALLSLDHYASDDESVAGKYPAADTVQFQSNLTVIFRLTRAQRNLSFFLFF